MGHLQRMMDESLMTESDNHYTRRLTEEVEKSLKVKFFGNLKLLSVIIAFVICISVSATILNKIHNTFVALNGWDISINEELKEIEIRK